MNKESLLAFAGVGVLALSSCTLSSDPTKGGLFWSPSKCQTEIINPLKEQEAASQARLDQAKARQQSLLKQKASLESQIRKARQSGASEEKLATLQKQVDSLQKQVDALSGL